MICKSRYIQYDKGMAYLQEPQGSTAGKNKYHISTIEIFHIKKYTSHSHSYYNSTCCLVVALNVSRIVLMVCLLREILKSQWKEISYYKVTTSEYYRIMSRDVLYSVLFVIHCITFWG